MVIFLTSSFVKYQPMNEYVPEPLDESNSFGDNLRKYWIDNAHFLIFTSDPSDEKMAAHMTEEMRYAFSMAGFSISEIRCFNYQSIENYRLQNGCSSEVAAREALKEALEKYNKENWQEVYRVYLENREYAKEDEFPEDLNFFDELMRHNEVEGFSFEDDGLDNIESMVIVIGNAEARVGIYKRMASINIFTKNKVYHIMLSHIT